MPETAIAQLASATFSVKVDGAALRDDVVEKMSYVVVEDCTALPDMALLSFHETMVPGDQSLLEETGLRVGKALQVSVASEDSTSGVDIFDGEVTAIETEYDAGKHWLIVRAFDKGSRLFRNPKARTFVDMTYEDIVTAVARDAGLTAETDSTSIPHEHVYQHNQTDAAFIAQLAAEVGFDFEVERGQILFKRPPPLTSPDVELELGDQLLKYNASITADGQVKSVKVHGWDVMAKQPIVGSADTNTVTSKLDDDNTMPSAIADAVGSREYATHAIPFGTQEETDAAAKALAELFGSSYAQVVGTARGNPGIKAGTVVKLNSIERAFRGMHRVTKSRHVFDNGEYQTHFECTGRRELSLHTLAGGSGGGTMPAADAVAASLPGLMVGIVTNNRDPDDLGRVKVKLPAISADEETGWMRVIQLGAGGQRGFFVLPEVNDEVVVAFEHGDIRRGYVLGGVWNGVDKPEQPSATGAARDSVEKRSFTSSKGHFLLFSDKTGDEFVQLATTDGKFSLKLAQDADGGTILVESNNKITINSKSDVAIKSDSKLTIESATELLLKSQKVTIQAQGGDTMLEGLNVKVAAQTGLNLEGVTFDLKGSGKGTINGGGLLEVKGGLVKIN